MLEKRYPEKGFFKNLINEVFGSGSEDIQSLEVEIRARYKLEWAENLTSDSSYETLKLQEASDLVNQARAEISTYLKYKNKNQYHNLKNLNNEIGDLEEEINNKLFKLINFSKKRLFLINRDKYSNNQFNGKPGMDLKLIKEDSEDIITVFYEDKPIGIVSNNFVSDFEKIFSDTSQLKYLPKVSSAKYFYKYGRFDIFEINMSKIKIKARLKQEKILKKYNKNELIAIEIEHDDIEFKQGMKFKLIKELNYNILGKIGVYLDDEKIGSVSNSYLTYNLTTKASDLKNIPDESYAEYLLKYEHKYPIARLIKKPVNDSTSKNKPDESILTDEHKNNDGSTIYSSETSLDACDDDNLKEKIAYVKKSSYRTKVIKSLDGEVKIPSQIAKDADIAQNSIYNTLKQLKEHELIECINPEVRKGKLYKLTANGEKIVKKLDK
jgi:DNA-binding HxlR family transcriptional regulator